MTDDHPKNLAASVRQRLQNLARTHSEDFQLILSRYALERLLQRIAQSPHAERFVVKGAILFHLWLEQPHRPTRDLDLLSHGDASISRLMQVFREICELPVEADGLDFLSESITGNVIRPDEKYQGVRIQLEARLARARIPVQVDIGFGDAITPAAQPIQFPSLLGFPTPIIATYPRETVIAEKLEALVTLGIGNSRMKDFYDLGVLAEQFPFDGETVARAVQATFERRGTPLPSTAPIALTDAFPNDAGKLTQWRAFLTRSRLAAPQLPELIRRLQSFLLPVLDAVRAADSFRQTWNPPGPWSAK